MTRVVGKTRIIRPEFFRTEAVVRCSVSARLLLASMKCFCDDGGVFPAECIRLKIAVFPGDSFVPGEIEGLVNELLTQELLREFTGSDGLSYWVVPGFAKDQRIYQPIYRYPQPTDSSSHTKD